MIPDTRYTRAGGVRIGYQDFGSGEPVLVIPGIVSNLDIAWEHETYRRMFMHTAEHTRVIMMDKRGMGVSDGFERAPTPDERVDDILAVLDAVSLDRVHIVAHSEGGLMAQLFAARFPEMVDKLVLSCSMIPGRLEARAAELGGAGHFGLDATWPQWRDILERWGMDASGIVALVHPSRVGEAAFERWQVRFARSSASPSQMKRVLMSVPALGEMAMPEQVQASTLVQAIAGDSVMGIGNGRVLAEVIPNATLTEHAGTDHFWVTQDNWREIADEQIEFITGVTPRRRTERGFAAVAFTDLVGSTAHSAKLGDERWRAVLEGHDRVVHRTVGAHGGRVVKSTGDGILATFPMPSTAASAISEIRGELRAIGLQIRAGVHAGEIEIHDDGDVSGIAVNIAARVEQAASDGAVFVSAVVRDMLLGSDHVVQPRGEFELKGIEGSLPLYELV